MKYISLQYLMEGLVNVCDEFIRKRLNFRNGLELLEQARAFRVDQSFKQQLNLVIKNRHAFILTSDDLASLPIADLIRLYRGVKTDFVIRAIHIWGRDMEQAEFQKVFRDELYSHINWANFSNDAMLELCKAGTLPMEKENEAMKAILSRTYDLPKDESETICSINLRVSRDDHSLSYRLALLTFKKVTLIPPDMRYVFFSGPTLVDSCSARPSYSRTRSPSDPLSSWTVS